MEDIRNILSRALGNIFRGFRETFFKVNLFGEFNGTIFVGFRGTFLEGFGEQF